MAKLMINYGDHKGVFEVFKKNYIARTKKRMRNNADKVAKAYAQLDLGSTAGND